MEQQVGALLAGLFRLAVELGYRWDGEQWVAPVVDSTLRAGPGWVDPEIRPPFPPLVDGDCSGSARSAEATPLELPIPSELSTVSPFDRGDGALLHGLGEPGGVVGTGGPGELWDRLFMDLPPTPLERSSAQGVLEPQAPPCPPASGGEREGTRMWGGGSR